MILVALENHDGYNLAKGKTLQYPILYEIAEFTNG